VKKFGGKGNTKRRIRAGAVGDHWSAAADRSPSSGRRPLVTRLLDDQQSSGERLWPATGGNERSPPGYGLPPG
jgi:hypothetical protein